MTPEQRALAMSYGQCFGTESGLRVLADLRKQCYVDRSTLSADLADMAAREGARSVYLYIAKYLDMAVSPDEAQEEAEH